MDPRQTPSSPPAEDVQENPQQSEAFQADESFRTAPNTFPFPGPVAANPVGANVPRLGPNELDLDDDPNADLYDPSTDQYWQRQARPRRSRSLDISPTRRVSGGLDDRDRITETATAQRYEGTDPRALQTATLEEQFAQIGSFNYMPLPTTSGVHEGGHVPRGAGSRPHLTPRSVQHVRGNVNPRGRPQRINPQAYVPPQPFPDYMGQLPTRFEEQLEQDPANYQPRQRPQQTPRAQAIGAPPAQVQRAPQTPDLPPPYMGQHARASILPPGDVVRWMQNPQQQGQQENVMGPPLGAQMQQRYPQQGPSFPLGPYTAPNLGQPQATQASVLASSPPRGSINQRPAPSAYGQTGYYPRANAPSAAEIAEFTGSRVARPQMDPTGPLRPVRRHSPPRTPPRHRRIEEEAAERHRKRRRQAEDESDYESMEEPSPGTKTRRQIGQDEDEDEDGDGDGDDDDEDQGETTKKSVKPAKKKVKGSKGSSKKSAAPKAQPSKRAPKTRIDHGELTQRADGTFWFRAHDTATWEPTVRHEPNREAMLADARQDPANPGGPDREYDVPPRAGPGPHNRTSYLEAHRHWYCRSAHDWHHETLDPIFYRFQRGDRPFRVDTVGPLRWRGQVVLNNDDEVITGWPDMPLTLSSRIEGWRLEAITRLDERISAEDFRDRMPRRGRTGEKAPQGASALGNHRSRFREENGLASWDARDGTSGYTQAIRSRLSADQRANNTTRGFNRLSPATIKNVREENRKKAKGSYAKRAGHKALTDQERAARAAGEKPTRTPMGSKPAKKTQEQPEEEPLPDPEADSEESTSEDEEEEGEAGDDSDVDNSAA